MKQIIDRFEGTYHFLSNFHTSPTVHYEGFLYPTVEHAYQAAKSLDPEVREKVRLADTPAQAKKMGKKIMLRQDWNFVKDQIMENLVRQKFEDPTLAKKLLATGDTNLVEGNWWNDTYWGVCEGVGLNKLGEILMKIREEIQLSTLNE